MILVSLLDSEVRSRGLWRVVVNFGIGTLAQMRQRDHGGFGHTPGRPRPCLGRFRIALGPFRRAPEAERTHAASRPFERMGRHRPCRSVIARCPQLRDRIQHLNAKQLQDLALQRQIIECIAAQMRQIEYRRLVLLGGLVQLDLGDLTRSYHREHSQRNPDLHRARVRTHQCSPVQDATNPEKFPEPRSSNCSLPVQIALIFRSGSAPRARHCFALKLL